MKITKNLVHPEEPRRLLSLSNSIDRVYWSTPHLRTRYS
jgi:hypothetical protein